MNLGWTDVAAMSAAGTAGAGLLFAVLRGRFGEIFVTKAEHEETVTRLDAIEQRLSLAPSHDDFKQIVATVSDLARDIAVVGERVDGMKETLARIERQTSLFLQARIEWERDHP
ncbi:MAG TPA: hypothetical protein PLO69_11175 [Gammaproteobacteria bacterium]|nr:hypothetical protein [Gammaproteobacteria bacterium]